jgi:hypothetical protein
MSKQALGVAALVVACVCSVAHASDPILQLDLNGLGIHARDSAGGLSSFGGLTHTGSVEIFFAPGVSMLAGVLSNANPPGPFVDQGFNGSLTNIVGSIMLNNGQVTGGSLSVEVNGASADPDYYTALVMPNSGAVHTFVGGGFTIEGLTFQGMFDDSSFGNVDVTPWMGGSLSGSFLQFNFSPNASGSGFADIDAFVVAPAPGSLVGLGLGGLALARRRRR